MTEEEVVAYPVMGYDEKGQLLQEPLGYVTPEDLEVINRSRGAIKDHNGFKVSDKEIKLKDFEGEYETKKTEKGKERKCIKEPIIDITKFQKYSFPLPEQHWVKWFGRVKKIEWKIFDPTIYIYYNETDRICYVHDIIKKKVTKYFYENVYPSDREILEFNQKQAQFIEFLRENDMDVEIKTEGEKMNTFKIIDSWSHTDRIDVFSRITNEERKNIILSRWIGATTWMPDIFTQIKGLLRLGHSIDEKGPLGTGRKPLIELQGKALEKGRRTQDEEEPDGFNLGK